MSNAFTFSSLLLAIIAAFTAPALGGPIKQFDSKYYQLHTDLSPEAVREINLRITHMAEEYGQRTSGFSGQIRERFPFYVFSTLEGYHQAGGTEGSAGVFDPNQRRLMAFAGKQLDDETWRVIQHEGFHQFAHGVIRGNLPVWLNEGLAEYFGESQYTGETMVSAVIPQSRLERVQKCLKDGRFPSVPDMLQMSHLYWNQNLSIENYDMAWMMVHFLAHGENGKYQKPFTNFINILARGQDSQKAWEASFGSVEGFEDAWQKYWREMPANPTLDRYTLATAASLNGLLARAISQEQTFDDFESFRAAAGHAEIKAADADWLPPSLARRAADDAKKLAETHGIVFTIEPQEKRTPILRAVLPDGRQIVGRFTLGKKKVATVTTDFEKSKKTPGKPGK